MTSANRLSPPQPLVLVTLALSLAAASLARGAEPAPAVTVGRAQSACLAEGMTSPWRRAGADSARQFVRSCLETSQPTPGLCQGAPAPDMGDVLGTEAWVVKGCADVGGPGLHCQELMAEVASYCHAAATP